MPEFSNIVWKKARRSELTPARARQIVAAFLGVPLRKHPAAPLLGPAFEIADGTGQTVYDCLYLALAVALDCRMVTADAKFHRALRAGPPGGNLLWVEDLP